MNLSPRLKPASSFQRCGTWLFLACVLAGCGRENIQVYRVPKETLLAVSGATDKPATPGVQWKTPPGWKEQPAGGMRAARFSVPGNEGQEADVSIILLPGISASKTDVVNLWREQIHRGPLKSDDELSSQLEKVEVGAGQGELFDMVSEEPMIKEKFKERILVVMLTQGSASWFFKMTGEDELVREQKPAFLSFLKSITFAQTSAEPAIPSPHNFASVNALPPVSPPAREGAGKPEWEVPPDWKEQPPGQMLLAKFTLGGSEGAKAEVTVSVFPGDVGGLLANVNRWRGQVGLTPVGQTEVEKLKSLDVIGGKATFVDMSGVSPKNGEKVRLLGAIVPREGRTWFYKLMGDEEVAGQQQASFLKFIQTVRYPNAG
jgi:hypothetical protein